MCEFEKLFIAENSTRPRCRSKEDVKCSATQPDSSGYVGVL